MHNQELVSRPLSIRMIGKAIRIGWAVFSRTRNVSVSYAMIFALIGLLILLTIEHARIAPMMLPMAGAFMLVGPILICGFFSLADRSAAKMPATLSHVLTSLHGVSREILVLATVCMLLLMIWITDAATLYGFMVGQGQATIFNLIPIPEGVAFFTLLSSVIGAVLAFVIFAISAFSVPLLYYRRAGLVQAIVVSVRTVLSNFLPCMLWALVLSGAVMASIFLLPLFLVVFPVLAFASHAIYKDLFPAEGV